MAVAITVALSITGIVASADRECIRIINTGGECKCGRDSHGGSGPMTKVFLHDWRITAPERGSQYFLRIYFPGKASDGLTSGGRSDSIG
jgi:hypothetical protein